MITTSYDYNSLLYLIQGTNNRQVKALTLPPDEPIYKIDLNTRTIEAPNFLSVQYDHCAETLYFEVDRYYDNIDLNNFHCVVQFQNADPNNRKKGFIYYVPYFDIITKENKIIFPWVIEGAATAFSGDVTFSIKFYYLNANGEYSYNLNTLTSKSKVLHGMDALSESENYIYDADTIYEIYQEIDTIRKQNDIYWLKME